MDRPHHVYWRPWDDPGLEHLRLQRTETGAEARGSILRLMRDVHLACDYRLAVDRAWQFRMLDLTLRAEPAEWEQPQRLFLERRDDGGWRVNGAEASWLAGCREVDIQITPFTNTLPIRRLGLEEGESADIRVVYVPVPSLMPEAVEQRYTCLAPLGAAGPDGGVYRYDGLFRNFTADLPVDAEGVVEDYRDTFRRVWPA